MGIIIKCKIIENFHSYSDVNAKFYVFLQKNKAYEIIKSLYRLNVIIGHYRGLASSNKGSNRQYKPIYAYATGL